MKLVLKATVIHKNHHESFDPEFKEKKENYAINMWIEEASSYTEIDITKDQYAELEVGDALRLTIEKD